MVNELFMLSQFYPEMYCTALIISTSRLFPYFYKYALGALMNWFLCAIDCFKRLPNSIFPGVIWRSTFSPDKRAEKSTDKSFSSYEFFAVKFMVVLVFLLCQHTWGDTGRCAWYNSPLSKVNEPLPTQTKASHSSSVMHSSARTLKSHITYFH